MEKSFTSHMPLQMTTGAPRFSGLIIHQKTFGRWPAAERLNVWESLRAMLLTYWRHGVDPCVVCPRSIGIPDFKSTSIRLVNLYFTYQVS